MTPSVRHGVCAFVLQNSQRISRTVEQKLGCVESAQLHVDRGKMILIPGSSNVTTLFLTSGKCIRPSIADAVAVAITGLGLSLCSRGPLVYMTCQRAWPGLDAAFYRTQQFLSDYKADASRFVKHSLLRLSCSKFILNYFSSNTRHEDIRSRLFDAGNWRRRSYLHGSCLGINILPLWESLIYLLGVQCLPIHHLVR